MRKAITWKDLMHDVVAGLPGNFTLSDVLKQRHRFEREFPNNRFVDAKIRQSLQVLRDQGMLRFVSPGRYQRLDVPPAFSPLIEHGADESIRQRSASNAGCSGDLGVIQPLLLELRAR